MSLFAGRMFDFHVLDMVELGVEKYVALSEIKVSSVSVTRVFCLSHWDEASMQVCAPFNLSFLACYVDIH